jgi:hypothetical protein
MLKKTITEFEALIDKEKMRFKISGGYYQEEDNGVYN